MSQNGYEIENGFDWKKVGYWSVNLCTTALDLCSVYTGLQGT